MAGATLAVDVRRARPRTLGYVPALDGVRAVAVAAVVLYHGDVAFTPGGFLGVDVFFVLSGYLITTLLLLEWRQTGRIDLGAFYARRARRLLPALLLLVGAVAAYAALIAGPLERARVRGDGIASLLYVANWRFVVSGQSYFEQFAEPSPLRHLWSLAIEEQWYLVWPVALAVLLAAVGGGRARLALAMAAAAVASAALMAALHDPAADPSRVYYGTDTRAQALLVGAAAAAVLHGRVLRGVARAALEVAGVAGGAVVVVLVATASETDAGLYRGGFLAVAVAAAAVVAAAAQARPGIVGMALAHPALVALGRISYGVYLWHWPVDVALTPDRMGFGGVPLLALRVGVTLVAASLSHRLVEAPVRAGALPGRAGLAAAAVAVVGAAALLAVATSGAVVDPLAAQPAGAAVAVPGADRAAATAPGAGPSEGAAPGDAGPQRGAAPTRVLVVGDSSAFTLGWWFRAEQVDQPLAIDLRAQLGCGVVRGDAVAGGRPVAQHEDCATWPDRWRAGVAAGPDVAVVLVGAWEVLDHRVGDEVLAVGTDAYEEYLRAELATGLDILAEGGQPVVLLTVPCYAEPDAALGGVTSERNDPDRRAWVDRVVRDAAAGRPEITVVDLAGWLCPGGEDRGEIDGVTVRDDGVHFTEAGANVVWRWLAPRLVGLARS